jgi:hypothetical protein
MRCQGIVVATAYLAASFYCGCARDVRPAPVVSACQGVIRSARAAREATPDRAIPPESPAPGVEECPEPIQEEDARGLATYNRFVERALDLPPGPDVLVAIRISPSFQPDRALSLRKTADGAYVLRSTRLLEDTWSQMMENMRRQQGHVIHIDERRQAQALDDLRATREIRERFVDSSTADLLVALWAAALKREQVPDTSDTMLVTMDGTGYRVWAKSGAVSMPNPRGTLGIAMSGMTHLERIVVAPSSGDCAQLEAAVAEMADALHRIRYNGPCTKRVFRRDP